MTQDAYQNILQKTFDRKIPFSAHWELTYRCNLACLHCYATNRDRQTELTLREIENVLGQLADMNCLFLTFTGGEILCRDDIIAILQAAKGHDFAMYLFTNGTRLTPELADQIAAVEPLSVELSLYSMNSAIHDRITGQTGSHARTLRAIALCRERHINIAIKCTLLKHNVGGYAELRQYAQSLGVRFVFDFMLVPADDGSGRMAQYGLTEEELYQFILEQAGPDWPPPEIPDQSAPLCGAGSNALCITPDGEVLPCLAVRQSIGNLKHQPLKALWTASALDIFRKSRYCDLVECVDCDCAAYCARCAGVALAECGNLLGKSPVACVIARATKRAAEMATRSHAGANDNEHGKEKDL